VQVRRNTRARRVARPLPGGSRRDHVDSLPTRPIQ
jgi:hypothetical protein